jgi:hypothetical protein
VKGYQPGGHQLEAGQRQTTAGSNQGPVHRVPGALEAMG